MVDTLSSFLDQFYSGHLVVNAKREISFSNQYITDLLGWLPETLASMNLNDIFTKASSIFIDSYVYPLLINEQCFEELQLALITSKGEKLAVVVSIKLDQEQTSYWSIYSCASRDKLYQELIQAKELLEKQSIELVELATVDSLTGLLNRRELENRASKMLSQAQRNKSSVALVIIDIDFFKNVNDTYGHVFGDDVLKSLGKILLKRHRAYDIVSRFGGEEFVVLLPDTDAENAFKVTEILRMDIEKTEVNGINITVSIGISLNNEHKNEFDTLFKEADSALYTAKHKGRNKTVLF